MTLNHGPLVSSRGGMGPLWHVQVAEAFVSLILHTQRPGNITKASKAASSPPKKSLELGSPLKYHQVETPRQSLSVLLGWGYSGVLLAPRSWVVVVKADLRHETVLKVNLGLFFWGWALIDLRIEACMHASIAVCCPVTVRCLVP